MTDKKWTDGQMAKTHKAAYENHCITKIYIKQKT